MNFLNQLHTRRKKLADVLSDDEYSGIRQIVEDLYPDQAHFIYELLQNAEDTSATEVNFNLQEDGLTFEHNGRSFNEKDVEGITNIGKRPKEEHTDKIGRFGIGFKAVFAYSETPYIWSPTYSFKITELVLPSEIPPNQKLGKKTRFEFPFNNPNKSPKSAYDEIEAGLKELSETTLLFLHHIQSITWKFGDNISRNILKVQHSINHVEVLKKKGDNKTSSLHFLHFSTPIEVDGRPTQSVSIAYPLEFLLNISNFDLHNALSKQMKITSASPGRVAVFFAAEKETSGLRFHLHAPFVPELSRASIKETPANDPLFNKIAALAASSLHAIKTLDLLTGDFLAILPNPQDDLPKRYTPIRQAIIEAMNNDPLTPTHSKSHAPARNLLQAKASLKGLLTEKDLKFLLNNTEEPAKWAINVSQRNSNQDRFIAGLEISTWDVEQFVNLLIEKISQKRKPWEDGPDKELVQWLSEKSPEWHQQLYSILYKELNDNGNFSRFNYTSIVRLSDGTYSTGNMCYFPTVALDNDEVFPRVDHRVYGEGKKKVQQEESRKFLENIGVREVGEAEEVEMILNKRYTYEAAIPNKRIYLKDLRRFIRLVEKDASKAVLFKDYHIFESINEEWSIPSGCYLDAPITETGLSIYFSSLGDNTGPEALSATYVDLGEELPKFVKFAIATGVINKLPISKTRCANNPQWEHLHSVLGSNFRSPINEDYVVKGLDKMLESPSIDLSMLLWRTMCDLSQEFLQATYQKNWSSGKRTADSQLVYLLKTAAWVPQKDVGFVRPCDASRDQLPKGFPFDEGQLWIESVEFGTTRQNSREADEEKNRFCKALGISNPKTIEIARELDRDPELLSKVFQLISQKSKKPLFPIRTVSNPDRRQERLAEQLAGAPAKEHEKRERSVRTTKGTIDPALSLKKKYTNDDGQMVCQICKDEMPFRKRDGEYYFEAVEALSEIYFSREHEAQYLALCPLCSAMYKEFVKQDEAAMNIVKEELMNSVKPEISLQLGDITKSIQFVESHFFDIRAILKTKGDSEHE